jgi:hypothetical protein
MNISQQHILPVTVSRNIALLQVIEISSEEAAQRIISRRIEKKHVIIFTFLLYCAPVIAAA